MIPLDLKRVWFYFTRHIDNFLLAGIFLLMLTGLVVLYSAAGGNSARVISQLTNIAVACVVMWVVANIPLREIMRMAFPLYVLGVVLLIAVALFGEVQNGARRWLNLGIVHIQPSELLKIAVPLMMAWYLDKAHTALHWRDYAVAVFILLLPVILIVRQPDLGTALLILISGFYVIFLAGLPWRILAGLAVMVAVSLPLLWFFGMHDYQRKRIITMLDPSQDALGAGYHTIQSTIAIGSGGISGKGWMKGTQSQLDFLPEPSTDFIFSVFSEEFGLIGNSLLLSLYLIVIGRCLIIAANAPTRFARLVAGSVTLTFFTYAFVNMGMVSGILPVVGIPLPLISYGGTSMVTILLGFGILMSIQTHPKLVKT